MKINLKDLYLRELERQMAEKNRKQDLEKRLQIQLDQEMAMA